MSKSQDGIGDSPTEGIGNPATTPGYYSGRPLSGDGPLTLGDDRPRGGRKVYERMYRFEIRWTEFPMVPKQGLLIRVWAKIHTTREEVEVVLRELIPVHGADDAALSSALADKMEEKVNAVEVLDMMTLDGVVAYNDWP